MNKRQFFSIFLMILAFGVTSHAGIAATGGASGTGKIHSAIPMPSKDLSVGLFGNMFLGDFMGLEDENGDKYSDLPTIARMDGAFAIAYGFTSFFETGFYLPLHRDTRPDGYSSAGVGDMKLSMKFNYPPREHKKGFELSLLAQAQFPMGKRVSYGYARQSWSAPAGVDDVNTPKISEAWTSLDGTVIAKMLTTANFGAIEGMFPLLLHLNWGMAFSGESRQNSLLLAGGVEVIPIEWLSLFWSFDIDIPVSGTSKYIPVFSYPIASSAGIEFNTPVGLGIMLGVDFTINQREEIKYKTATNDTYYRSPSLGFYGELSYDFSFAKAKEDTVAAPPVAPTDGVVKGEQNVMTPVAAPVKKTKAKKAPSKKPAVKKTAPKKKSSVKKAPATKPATKPAAKSAKAPAKKPAAEPVEAE